MKAQVPSERYMLYSSYQKKCLSSQQDSHRFGVVARFIRVELKAARFSVIIKAFIFHLLFFEFFQKRFTIQLLVIHLFRVEVKERFIRVTIRSDIMVTVSSDESIRRLWFLIRCSNDRRGGQFGFPTVGWRSFRCACSGERAQSVGL